jgi:hypothetical protein
MRLVPMSDDRHRSGTPDRRVISSTTVVGRTAVFIDETMRLLGSPLLWPYSSLKAVTELLLNSFDTVYRGDNVRYGDGKPVVMVPGHLGSDVTLEPLSMWLHAIGYRPAKSNVLINVDDRLLDVALAVAVRDAAIRVGRKAVIVAFDTGLRAALRVAETELAFVSDVVGLGPVEPLPAIPAGMHLHLIRSASKPPPSSDGNVHHVRGSRALLSVNPDALRTLSTILRDIPIVLLDQA